MAAAKFTRREFLKLAALGALGVAAKPLVPAAQRTPVFCPPMPPTVAQGPLSATQQARLAAAARSFIAPTMESAREVALAIDFIEGRNEDVSTVCGPLAIAILQAAGLLGPWASRHDFWLLNPRTNLKPVKDTFPVEIYDWYEFSEPFSKADLTKFPLEAGDLVYLHAGSGGTFEHMFVVTRVDAAGRRYTVTNLFIATGSVIEERMLYDPADPGVGQIYAWANRDIRNTLGNTGDGGFRVWRVKDGASLEFPTDDASVALRAGLDELLLPAAGEWYARIQQVDGALLYQFAPYVAFHPASTIKVPVALGFYHWLESQNVNDWDEYLTEHGVKQRSYAQLLRAMLVESEEEATEILVEFLGKAKLDELWQSWGLFSTKIDPRRSSARDVQATLESLLGGNWVSEAARMQILDLMGTYTPNDEARLGLLRAQLPTGTRIYNKRGSLVDWPRVVADSAIIQLPGDGPAYIFTLHGIGRDEAGYDDLEIIFDQAVALFGDYLEAQS